MTQRHRRRLTILALAVLLPLAISQLVGCMCLRNMLNGMRGNDRVEPVSAPPELKR
jgi:hypothetical protein